MSEQALHPRGHGVGPRAGNPDDTSEDRHEQPYASGDARAPFDYHLRPRRLPRQPVPGTRISALQDSDLPPVNGEASEVRGLTGCINSPCFAPQRRDLVAALEHVRTLNGTHKIAAVNFSSLIEGTAAKPNQPCDDLYPDVRDAVNNLLSLGVPVVASAGNDGRSAEFLVPPACISTVMSVGYTKRLPPPDELEPAMSTTGQHGRCPPDADRVLRLVYRRF
jgi:hypothetical protein